MATVTIRLVTEHDPVSDIIRAETWCTYSHVEFVLDDGTTLGAHASGGVAIRPIDYAKFTAEQRFTLHVADEQKAAILGYAHAQVGKPYDFLDIVGILTHRDWRSPKRWICSELVAAAFEKGGFPLLNAGEAVNRITPRDIYLSPYLIGCKS